MADNDVRQKWKFNPVSKMPRAAKNATGKNGLKAQSFGASESVQYIAEREKKSDILYKCFDEWRSGTGASNIQQPQTE